MAQRTALIHIEGVPNPNAIKFVLENGVLTDQPYEFRNYAEAKGSPLARKLLLLKYIDRVLISSNFITVLKNPQTSPGWDDILFQVRAIITEHLDADEPIVYVGTDAVSHAKDAQGDATVLEMVRSILDRGIRPAAQADGGDILVESLADGVLTVSMHGSCHGCPYIQQTVKQGVEMMIRDLVPEIRSVVAVAS